MLNKIDKLSKTEFTEVFGNIFENASWIAEKLYLQKPFKNFQNLSNEMISIFENANNQNKLKILNSHPDLADKAKIGSLTLDSNNEQNDAGLNQCTEKEFNDFKNLNLEYKNISSNLSEKNNYLSDRVKRLQTNSIDLDYLDEKIRQHNGFVDDDELLIVFD